MRLSAYAIALGVEQRRYPWREAIVSALEAADEFCLAYDPRFDDPGSVKVVDRVKLVELEFEFGEWDFIASALNRARKECCGDWCLLTEMDAVLSQGGENRISDAIDRAEREGHEAINVRWFSCIQGLVDLKKFKQGAFRQSITKNESWLYHKSSDYMIGQMDSDIWEGKFINNYGFDDFSYYDERANGRFYTEKAEFVETDYSDHVKDALASYTHIWHYGFYNPGRKNAQGRQTKLWQDRVYGRSKDFDIDSQIALLKQRLTIDPEETKRSLEYFAGNGFSHADINHPEIVKDWVEQMGLDAV
jgi:hypothetical protein